MTPKIHTYHCLCTTLILTTTHALSTLPTHNTGATSVIVLPLEPFVATSLDAVKSSTQDGSVGDNDDDVANVQSVTQAVPTTQAIPTTQVIHHTQLSNTTRAPNPLIIRTHDGFEVRYVHSCNGCGLSIGYELGREMYERTETEGRQTGDTEGKQPGDTERKQTGATEGKQTGDTEGKQINRMVSVLYILPGGLMSTQVMKSGRRFGDMELMLGGTGRMVGAWE